MRFDLEAELEKLVKLMKQLEILLSDIEQLTKVHAHFHIMYSYFVRLRECMSGYMHAILLQGCHCCLSSS